jgi:thiol-disulfide isomerase/thioredoxin
MLYNFNEMQTFNQQFKSFDQNVLGQRPFKLLVWAKWCGHCTRMEPNWNLATADCQDDCDIVQIEDNVARHLKSHHPNIEFVDVINHAKGYPFLASVSFAIKSNNNPLPTVHVDEHGDARDLDGLMSFLTGKRPIEPTPSPTKTRPTSPRLPSASAKKKVAATRPASAKKKAATTTTRPASAPVKKKPAASRPSRKKTT